MFRLFSSSLLFLLIVLAGCGASERKNILGIFPYYGFSHFKVFHPILSELAQRGHNVTVITYIKSPQTQPNYNELLLTGAETIEAFDLKYFNPQRTIWDIYEEFWQLYDEGKQCCETFFESGYVEKILEWHRQTPFDLVITEFFNADCYLAVPELLNVPVVAVSSSSLLPYYYDRIRLPNSPSYIISECVGYSETWNWQERLMNFVQAEAQHLFYSYFTNSQDNALIKKYLNVDMDVREVAKKRTSLILVNQHYTLGSPRPLTPQVIEIGGIHINESEVAAPLPDAIDKFLANLKTGERVLFISWGSMLRGSTLDLEKRRAIIETLKRLPLKVIWKWELDEKPTNSPQFLFVKWAPQLTLLCHPKVHFFWGHGGLLGTTEAAYCGKPTITTPVYGDQFLNGYAVQTRKMTVILEYKKIQEQTLKESLEKIMQANYTERAAAISRAFRQRQVPPLDNAIWWIEYLLKNGPLAHELLQSRALYLNWFVYHSLDSLAILIIPSMLFAYFLWYISCFMFKRLSPKTNELVKKKKK